MASLFGGPPNPYSTQRAPGTPGKLSGLANTGSIHPGGTGIPYGTMPVPKLPAAPRVGRETVPGSSHVPFPAGASGVPGSDIHLRGTRIPGAPTVKTTVPGGSSTSVPGGTPPPPTYPSPLDSTYFQQLNNATLAATNKIDASNLQSGYARVDLQNALDQLGHQQGLQTTQAQNAENSRGGFALGHLGDTLGQLNRSFLDRQGADQQTYERGEAARSAARAAISQGLTLEQAALAAAAADRASAQAAHNPAVGQTGPSLTAPAAAPSKPAVALSPHPASTQNIVPGSRSSVANVFRAATNALSNGPPKAKSKSGALSQHPARSH